jgi:hypothetical protein
MSTCDSGPLDIPRITTPYYFFLLPWPPAMGHGPVPPGGSDSRSRLVPARGSGAPYLIVPPSHVTHKSGLGIVESSESKSNVDIVQTCL